jgi:hypothetical protein
MFVIFAITVVLGLGGATFWWAHHCGFMAVMDEISRPSLPADPELRQKELFVHNQKSNVKELTA